MKVMVVFDSVYGNTKMVAEEMAHQLQGMGHETISINLAEQDAEGMTADALCIGSPTRMKRATSLAKRFVKGLDKDDWMGKPIIVFDTILQLPTDPKEREKAKKWTEVNAAIRMEKLLLKKGLSPRSPLLHIEVTGMKGPLAIGYQDSIKAQLPSLISP